jgi:hypothetical protein
LQTTVETPGSTRTGQQQKREIRGAGFRMK